jgi:hypothetical protein
MLMDLGDTDQAVRLATEALEVLEAALPAGHPTIANALVNLAVAMKPVAVG